jgi:hypothetical protein
VGIASAVEGAPDEGPGPSALALWSGPPQARQISSVELAALPKWVVDFRIATPLPG